MAVGVALFRGGNRRHRSRPARGPQVRQERKKMQSQRASIFRTLFRQGRARSACVTSGCRGGGRYACKPLGRHSRSTLRRFSAKVQNWRRRVREGKFSNFGQGGRGLNLAASGGGGWRRAAAPIAAMAVESGQIYCKSDNNGRWPDGGISTSRFRGTVHLVTVVFVFPAGPWGSFLAQRNVGISRH